MNLPYTGPEGMDLRQVLFPNGSPKMKGGMGPLGNKAAGAPAGGPLDYISQRNNFNMNLPFTGPEGMDLRQVLFPNGAPPKRNRGG
ncbi:MAG: hypothetical protein IPG84_18240 [Betaproteobacteria bacterium]|nr:hypothetical protein [Betaproteobacteria bacterium]